MASRTAKPTSTKSAASKPTRKSVGRATVKVTSSSEPEVTNPETPGPQTTSTATNEPHTDPRLLRRARLRKLRDAVTIAEPPVEPVLTPQHDPSNAVARNVSPETNTLDLMANFSQLSAPYATPSERMSAADEVPSPNPQIPLARTTRSTAIPQTSPQKANVALMSEKPSVEASAIEILDESQPLLTPPTTTPPAATLPLAPVSVPTPSATLNNTTPTEEDTTPTECQSDTVLRSLDDLDTQQRNLTANLLTVGLIFALTVGLIIGLVLGARSASQTHDIITRESADPTSSQHNTQEKAVPTNR